MTENKSKSFFEADLRTLYQGETPEDIQLRCSQLCNDYLGGIWLQVNAESLEVKRISGGFTNQLFYCALPQGIKPIDKEPKEVAIRLYGAKHFNSSEESEQKAKKENERLSDVIIGLIISQNRLGPKIYGMFQDGQIMKYYKHHQFRKDYFADPERVNQLGKILARIHALNVPIKRNDNWVFKDFEDFYNKAYEMFPIEQYIKEGNYETFLKFDLKSELEWLKKAVNHINSPIVFSHNDFRGSNVLIVENPEKINNTADEPQIIVCDFEYSSYSYRGVDLGTIFNEWGFADINDFWKNEDNFPDDSVVSNFLDGYVNEFVKLLGNDYRNNPNNSIAVLIKEVKAFVLVSKMFIILFMLYHYEPIGGIEVNKKSEMPHLELNYKNYHYFKEKFLKDGVFSAHY